LEAGADHLPIFALKSAAGADGLFALHVAEVPAAESPTLIDPSILGVNYLGAARLLLDPYTGLSTNTLRLRLEHEVLFHVRDIAGVHVIAGE
jgi:hypothetical protein